VSCSETHEAFPLTRTGSLWVRSSSRRRLERGVSSFSGRMGTPDEGRRFRATLSARARTVLEYVGRSRSTPAQMYSPKRSLSRVSQVHGPSSLNFAITSSEESGERNEYASTRFSVVILHLLPSRSLRVGVERLGCSKALQG
jgi:hypothetical protein